MIPVSVLICVKNEEARLVPCLEALQEFDDVIVVDSYSTDSTAVIAQSYGVRVEQFQWNGQYPKKYQWALENVSLKYDRVLFVDADEIITAALANEIAVLDWQSDGYFIKGRPIWRGRAMHHGLWNNKLALFDKTKFVFPVVNDLDIPGGTEIEGHYQPVAVGTARIGQLKAPMLHDCGSGWHDRHKGYVAWEAIMMQRQAFPVDPVPAREKMKRLFRAMPLRGSAVFLYGYVWHVGFLDGFPGLDYALAKARYYSAISRARKNLAQAASDSAPVSA